jgi:hypothetical protein
MAYCLPARAIKYLSIIDGFASGNCLPGVLNFNFVLPGIQRYEMLSKKQQPVKA